MTISTAAGTGLIALKSGQHETWSSGDYGSIAWVTVPLADELIATVDLVPGRTVLDVRHRRRSRRHRGRPGPLPDGRDRPRRRTRRHRRPPGGRRGPGHDLQGRRRGGIAVRRRPLRLRAVSASSQPDGRREGPSIDDLSIDIYLGFAPARGGAPFSPAVGAPFGQDPRTGVRRCGYMTAPVAVVGLTAATAQQRNTLANGVCQADGSIRSAGTSLNSARRRMSSIICPWPGAATTSNVTR